MVGRSGVVLIFTWMCVCAHNCFKDTFLVGLKKEAEGALAFRGANPYVTHTHFDVRRAEPFASVVHGLDAGQRAM